MVGLVSLLLMDKSQVNWMNDWMFIYYVVISPIIVVLGVIISHLEKPSEEFILKRITFFEKVGTPWFGKKAYLKQLEYRNQKKI